MSTTDLQNWLITNPGFQKHLKQLTIDSVGRQFSMLKLPSTDFQHDWNYLLMCASLLAQSRRASCQDAALRIAQACLEYSGLGVNYKDAATVILDSLANQLAVKLAQNRRLLSEGTQDRLPFPLLQDWTRRSLENSITLKNASTILVNKFQKEFWENANGKDWISVSAPTSAGKSYIICRWIAEYLRGNPTATVVYLVPTRALIQQVQQDIDLILKEEGIKNYSVSTLPLRSSVLPNKTNLLVFTQERFHILIGDHFTNLKVDLLVVDEAHKIGDNYRGILLQQAIERAVQANNRCKIVFASPMTENPEVLLEDSPPEISGASIVSEDVTVNQNLLWISQAPGNPVLWNVELIVGNNPTLIGQINLPSRPSPDSKRLPFVAYAMAELNGGNVIYANGAADAEDIAKQIFDLLQLNSMTKEDEEIKDLIELIQKTIHRKYSLARVLERGIAFHYGNMPLLIRTEIERLFRANKIKYLICTSTLIEGVNMPCRSVFLRGPTKGRGNPISPGDFWNLAGRAGRWGKEFQGNVICVDARRASVWKDGTPTEKTPFKIVRTSDSILGQPEKLLTYVNGKTLSTEVKSDSNLEYAFSYLMSCKILNGNLSNTRWSSRFPSNVVKNIEDALVNVETTLTVPNDVILKNPGISPIAMENLLSYFKRRTFEDEKPVESLIPVLPESEDATDEYTKILHRINKYLGDVFGRGKRVRQLGLLIVDWMRGYPLARIVASREKYYGSTELAALIRNTMKDVEEIARFQAPKYLSCYVDLLKTFLSSIDRPDLLHKVFDINILLEFGVSQKTQLSLMGLGLSRTSAISISEFIANDSLDEEECLFWLQANNWMTQDLPVLIRREISNMLKLRA